MKIHSKNLSALLGACLLPLLSQAAAPAADPLAAYYDNTLACQNQVSKAVCRVWLNRDGHYYAFYDLGVQAKTRRDIEPGGGSRNAEAKLVGGRKGALIEAYGRVEDSRTGRGIDL